MIGARLRSGNRHTAHKAVSFLGQCLERLPKDRVVRLRMDAGFYAREIVEFLLARGLDFSISARLAKAFRAAVEGLSETAWNPYPWEEGTEWAEPSYRPQGWPRPFRMLVKRQPLYEGSQLLLGESFCTPVITNRRGAAPSLLKHHPARGGSENYIEEFKNGLGARLLPSQQFLAHHAWLVIAQLAYNLGQWFKLLVLPSRSHADPFKKLRLHWFCVAARIVRSGRQTTLALARGPDLATRFAEAQTLIRPLSGSRIRLHRSRGGEGRPVPGRTPLPRCSMRETSPSCSKNTPPNNQEAPPDPSPPVQCSSLTLHDLLPVHRGLGNRGDLPKLRSEVLVSGRIGPAG